MNKEFLLGRLNQMQQGKAMQERAALQASANVNAFEGAIQEISFLIKSIEDEEATKAEPNPDQQHQQEQEQENPQ